MLARLAVARAETQRRLAELPPVTLSRPSIWAGYEIDVRSRLHRFAAHVVEHTIQCEKTLAATGHKEEEGRRIVRRIFTARGELEGLETQDLIRRLDRDLAERIVTVEKALAGG
jgi:hypothetical protein